MANTARHKDFLPRGNPCRIHRRRLKATTRLTNHHSQTPVALVFQQFPTGCKHGSVVRLSAANTAGGNADNESSPEEGRKKRYRKKDISKTTLGRPPLCDCITQAAVEEEVANIEINRAPNTVSKRTRRNERGEKGEKNPTSRSRNPKRNF